MSTNNNTFFNRYRLFYFQLFLLCTVLMPCSGQENYIRIRTATAPVSPGTALSSSNSLAEISYYDTAGRLVQEVSQGITPDGTDMATLTVYDGQNRVKQQWAALPFSSSNGEFHSRQEFTGSPYSAHYHHDYHYTPSGLQYTVDESGVHSMDKAVRTEYLVNTDSNEALSVAFYSGYTHSTYKLRRSGTYPEGSLTCVKVTDEDGNSTYRFYDQMDHLILDRRHNTDGWYDTYYVYDDYYQLCCILPPLVHDALTENKDYIPEITEVLQQYAYLYRYDRYGHCTMRKLPGADWDYTVYDGDHRPILHRTDNHGQKGYWAYKQYDGLGRIVLEGNANESLHLDKMVESYSNSLIKITFVGAQGNRFGYTDMRIHEFKLQTVDNAYYYDNYDFLSLPLFQELSTTPPANQGSGHTLPTGKYTATLDNSGEYELEVYYYDSKGRCIQTDRYNSISRTTTHTTSAYNFLDAPVQTVDRYTTPEAGLQRTISYAYDHAGRETEADISFLYQPKGAASLSGNYSLCRNSYDGFGRISRQRLFNNQDEVVTEYADDGRLHATTNRHFSQRLYYSELLDWNGKRFNNGLISGTEINQNGRKYLLQMSYDALGRYCDGWTADSYGTESVAWSESFQFDKMGNTTSIIHCGPKGFVNVLYQEFEGNHLKHIRNSSPTKYPPYEYYHMFCDWDKNDNGHAYDRNGNETKNIAARIHRVDYNLLNLPDSMMSSAFGNTSRFTYFGDGRRVSSVYYTYSHNMDYMLENPETFNDPISVYKEIRDGDLLFRDGKLSRVYFPGGYLNINSGSTSNLEYQYFITDYLGSIRTTCDGITGAAVQHLEYLPSGIVFSQGYNGVCYQNKRFCAKEAIDMHGYGLYDSGARFLHSKILNFQSIDPLCEKYPGVSPYVYCMNNPVSLVDPDGRDWYRHNETGNYYWQEGHDELENYTNVGSSVSIQLGENSYLNCYQNGGILANQAVSAFDLIRSSPKLQNQFLGKGSVLSDQSQAELFRALNSRDMEDIGRPIGKALVEFGAAELAGPLAGRLIGWGAKGLSRLFGKAVGKAGTYSVYRGVDAADKVKYVGITGREPIIRFIEHSNSGTAKSTLKYKVIKGATNLTKDQARMWEQTLINQYGLEKNGGVLINKINSIATKNWGLYGIK